MSAILLGNGLNRCLKNKVIDGNWKKAYCKIWEEIGRLEG